ncbi:hypothetical protein BSKO_08879 [Bryopsis sp. KO-2023]|nr:hypothetical protein BSKO_08879 [Bryopsis sp. KO-2023]
MPPKRRSMREILDDATLLDSAERREAAFTNNARIIRDRMDLTFRQAGATGVVFLFPRDGTTAPFLYVHRLLRGVAGRKRLEDLREAIEATLAVERTVNTASGSFKTLNLSFRKKKSLASYWMKLVKRRESLPDYISVTNGDWPEQLHWAPGLVPYRPPHDMTTKDRTEGGELWIDIILDAIAENWSKEVLMSSLESGDLPPQIDHVDAQKIRHILDTMRQMGEEPPVKSRRTCTREKTITPEDVEAAHRIGVFWDQNGVELSANRVAQAEVHLGCLHNAVKSLGGGCSVTERKNWGKVADILEIPKGFKNRGWRLKKIWEEEIAPVERGTIDVGNQSIRMEVVNDSHHRAPLQGQDFSQTFDSSVAHGVGSVMTSGSLRGQPHHMEAYTAAVANAVPVMSQGELVLNLVPPQSVIRNLSTP